MWVSIHGGVWVCETWLVGSWCNNRHVFFFFFYLPVFLAGCSAHWVQVSLLIMLIRCKGFCKGISCSWCALIMRLHNHSHQPQTLAMVHNASELLLEPPILSHIPKVYFVFECAWEHMLLRSDMVLCHTLKSSKHQNK